MSWREILGVGNSPGTTPAHNSHNAQNPLPQGNSVNCVNSVRGGGVAADTVVSPTTGQNRLESLAGEFSHSLEDLLAWYAADLEDLGTLPFNTVRLIVADYIENRAHYRRLAGLPAGEPHADDECGADALVFCRGCAHWVPDPINPPSGLGICQAQVPGPAWPHLPRRCKKWEGTTAP